jgi:hypothetical protein
MHESGLLSPRRLRSSRPVTLSNSVLSRMVISRPWESVLSCHSASVLSHVSSSVLSRTVIVGICLANAIRLCSQNLGLHLGLFLYPVLFSVSFYLSSSSIVSPVCTPSRPVNLNLSSNQCLSVVSLLLFWFSSHGVLSLFLVCGILYCFGFNRILVWKVHSEGEGLF